MRITAGVMVPTLLLAQQGWLQQGMPFLWGSLFVSLTDTPGPIHHRRNGMLTAIALNTVSVLIALLCRNYPALLLTQIIVMSFFFSLLGVYGSRAGAVGTLAMVITLLNLFPRHGQQDSILTVALIAAGGLWYMLLSLLLYRLRPYRLAEQAIGEHLIVVADYIRARGSFYRPGIALSTCFDRVMQAQVVVQKSDEQTRELLFKTRQFVVDASPRSRSMMMIFLDAVDLFELSVLSYQDYESLHQNLERSGLLPKVYSVILQVAAGLEYTGLSIQAGKAVRKDIDMTVALSELEDAIEQYSRKTKDPAVQDSLQALRGTVSNIRSIVNRLQRIVLYTRLEVDVNRSEPTILEVTKFAAGQPLKWQTLVENLTLESNHFRYSLRLTLAMLAGFGVAMFFSLTHAYWVLLTIITILRPVYTLTSKRNIQRVGGTFIGAFLAIAMLFFITNTTILLVVMILSMLIAYSLLRVNYFSFVLFLTLFIILTFHFLNPVEVKTLVMERLLDTVIGSILAALASRFILPVWEHEQMETSLADMLAANRSFFTKAWSTLHHKATENPEYKASRQKAIVTLTNLSDKFQKMLAEPHENKRSIMVHQMVIANHMLTGHIAALSSSSAIVDQFGEQDADAMARSVDAELKYAENYLRNGRTEKNVVPVKNPALSTQTLNPLSIIYSLSHDIRSIAQKI